jgi:hypothetical protein
MCSMYLAGGEESRLAASSRSPYTLCETGIVRDILGLITPCFGAFAVTA